MSRNNKGDKKGRYRADITLGIPEIQDKDFVEKAGIEYENLIGSLVNRYGLGPTVEYSYCFNID